MGDQKARMLRETQTSKDPAHELIGGRKAPSVTTWENVCIIFWQRI